LTIEKNEEGKFLLKENFVSEATADEIEKVKQSWKNQKRQIEAEIAEMKKLLEIKPNVENSQMMNYIYAKAGVIFPTEDTLELKRGQLQKLDRRINEMVLPEDIKPIDVEKEIKTQESNKEQEEKKNE
jgi:succinate dehydrogenase/fumarate reductase flavoprotein subunit